MNRRSVWIIPALAIGVIGFGLYGFNEHQNRMAAVQMAENQYQGSYHRLMAHVDLLQDSLAKLSITNSFSSIEKELSAAQRQTAAAIANVEGLPAKLVRNGSLISYLTHTSAYLEQLHLSHVNGRPLTATERKRIQQLYKQTTKLENEMTATQGNLFAKMQSFQMTGAMVESVNNINLQRQFEHIDGDAKQMLSENGRMHMDPLQLSDSNVASFLNRGPIYSSDDALSIAKRFLGYSGVMKYSVQRLGPGVGYPGYLVTLSSGTKETDRLAVSSHGGKVVWMTRTPYHAGSSISQGNVNLLVARHIAFTFLNRHGFHSVAVLRSYSSQLGHSFAFAPVYHGTVIEPQVILIKVPSNWMAVSDFDASAFYANPIRLSTYRPGITPRQARLELTPQFKVENEHLAVVYDPTKHPHLVYSILGRTADSTFRVIVDANNGTQLQIEKLSKEQVL